jgi:hypothetical protein
VILMEYVNGGSLKVKPFVFFLTLMYYFSTIVVMFF